MYPMKVSYVSIQPQPDTANFPVLILSKKLLKQARDFELPISPLQRRGLCTSF